MSSKIVIPDDGGLRGECFEKEDLSCYDFSRLEVEDSSFKETRLSNSLFSSSVLRRVEFSGCDLSSVSFSHAYFKEVCFTDCLLTGVDFSNCTFKKVAISTSKGIYASFSFSRCDFLTLDRCEFSNSDFRNLDIRKMVVKDSSLKEASFTSTFLKDIVLANTSLEAIRLSDDLKEARGACLSLENALSVLSSVGIDVDMSL